MLSFLNRASSSTQFWSRYLEELPLGDRSAYCPRNHKLKVRRTSIISAWTCNNCKESRLLQSSTQCTCRQCDYDLCESCFSALSKEVGTNPYGQAIPQSSRLPADETWEVTMADFACDVEVPCSDKSVLARSESAHTTTSTLLNKRSLLKGEAPTTRSFNPIPANTSPPPRRSEISLHQSNTTAEALGDLTSASSNKSRVETLPELASSQLLESAEPTHNISEQFRRKVGGPRSHVQIRLLTKSQPVLPLLLLLL